MKTSVATSRRSDSADGSGAPFRRASFAWPGAQRERHLERRASAGPRQDDASGVLAEANQLGVLPRARREALGREVQRLEQVRLADAITADDEHEARLERQVERRVRAVVAERDPPDDQVLTWVASPRAGSA